MSRFLLLNFEDFGLNQDITKTIQSHTLFCICCLERNVAFINIATCSHSDYLDNFTRPELKPINEVICHTCHNMLKKIKQFKVQVEQSFNLLTTQALDSEGADIRKPNFELCNVVNINIPSETPNPSETEASTPVPPDKTTTPVPEPTPTPPANEKQMKNIKEALKIIDNNTKNASVKLFTDSVKNLVEKEAAAITESVACFIKTEIPEPPVIVKIEGNTSVEEGAQETPVSPNILNIRTVMITEDELKEERATIAASDAYQKMPHRCDKCLIGFNYKENLEDHNNRKHMAKKGCVVCDICEQILYPAGGYAAHKYRHFSRFECAKCCKRYHCYESAVDHYKLAHTEQVERPTGRRRRPEYRLPRQDRDRSPHAPPTHTVVKRQNSGAGKKHLVYRCSICKQVLKNYENLQKHMQIKHFKNSGLECDLCGRKYTIAMSKNVVRECEHKITLKNKISVRRPGKTSTERSREFRQRKKVLRNAINKDLNIITKTPKTPAERSRDYRARKRQRPEENVETEVNQDNSQPSTSSLLIKRKKTSTERVREFRARKKT